MLGDREAAGAVDADNRLVEVTDEWFAVDLPGSEVGGLVDAALKSVLSLRDDDLTRPYPNMGYRQYPRIREEINSLYGAVSRAPASPTEGEALRTRELTQELDAAIARLNQIQSDQVGKINEAMKGVPFITVETIR